LPTGFVGEADSCGVPLRLRLPEPGTKSAPAAPPQPSSRAVLPGWDVGRAQVMRPQPAQTDAAAGLAQPRVRSRAPRDRLGPPWTAEHQLGQAFIGEGTPASTAILT